MAKQSIVLSLLLLVLSYAGNSLAEGEQWLSPERVEGTTLVDIPQAVQLHAQGVPFIDVRVQRHYDRRHIPGAHHLELKTQFTRENLAKIAAPSDTIVIYCNGIKCSRSYRAATQAVAWGYSNIQYFREGMRGWRLAGHPIEVAEQ